MYTLIVSKLSYTIR